jgi:hypothetical protein
LFCRWERIWEENVESQAWELAAKIVAVLSGVVVGSAAIGTACSVWARRQVFAYAGSALCVVGIVLIGMSIWQSVEFGVGSGFVTFKGIAGGIKTVQGEIIVNGKPVDVPQGPTQIGFWTPSARTKETVDVKKWETIESDETLDVFANRLMKAKIIEGFRRYEVIGEGIGSKKVGAWWVSTNGANFQLKNFLREYADFWKPGDDATYMEILPLRSGGYQPSAPSK